MSMPKTPLKLDESKLPDYYKMAHNQKIDHLPGPKAWPLIGNTFHFIKDPLQFNEKLRSEFGDVYRINLFFRNVAALVGPEANQLVLLDRSRNFSSKMGWNDRIGQLFTDGLMLRDFSDHRLHKRIMSKSFGASAMKNYADIMNETISTSLSHWDGIERLDFYRSFKNLTLRIAAAAFVGIPPGEDADRLNRAFIDTVSASIAFIRLAIPGFKFKRGLEGRQYLIQYLRKLLPEKRRVETKDMFSQFCHSQTPEGDYFSDQDVINHMIFLLMAAHDTITSSVTSLVYFLASEPEWQNSVREEGKQINQGALAYDQLDKLPVLEACFNEALRFYPPVPMIPRRSVNAFEYKGVEVPARTQLFVNPFMTHRLPEYWSSPSQFDPSRFLDRKEHLQHPYLFVPFGGGAHMCIGRLFAYLEMKLFMHQLIQRYQISLPAGYHHHADIIPIPKPRNDLPILLKRLQV